MLEVEVEIVMELELWEDLEAADLEVVKTGSIIRAAAEEEVRMEELLVPEVPES
jgi:hypothetical protein